MTSPKISLCIITGNCIEYIDRCLSSFGPYVDEIIVVRAIGNQISDATLDRACGKYGAITGEYFNAPEHRDWPHVDNFAAARNLSFSLATGDYILWADTDDILESGGELIRELATRGGYAAFLFPYRIMGLGVRVPRERLLARDSGVWQYAVHECFTFKIEPVQAVEDQRIVITHMPHLSKFGSNERNLRILESIPVEEMNCGQLYHLQGELAAVGRLDESVAICQKALAHKDLGVPEEYELWLNLVKMSKDPAEKETLLLQAMKTDPSRREAFGVMAGHCLDHGLAPHGLAWARMMMALPRSEAPDWNERGAFYGYLAEDILCQALRCNRQTAEAEAIRKASLNAAGGAIITLIHATRGRPLQACHTRKAWLDLADEPDRIEHIFVFDSDDTESHALRRMHHLEVTTPNLGCVNAWNTGAFYANSQVLIQVSDDFLPPPRWDTEILARLGDVHKPAVLAVSDGSRTDDLLCIAIMTREYWLQDMFMFHPSFTGVYSDNFLTDTATHRKQIIQARDLVFTHYHPAFGLAAPDETYRRQNSPEQYEKGLAIYQRLTAGPIGDWSTIPGFMDYWQFYRAVAGNLRDGDTAVEIGCWLGRSCVYLAQELQRLGKHVDIIAIDNFLGEENQIVHEATVAAHGGSLLGAFRDNVDRCGVSDLITTIVGDSADSASAIPDASVHFCWIDAAHDYDSVIRDIRAWLPKMAPGSMLAGHDAAWHEVKRAVDELLPTAKFNSSIWCYMVPAL